MSIAILNNFKYSMILRDAQVKFVIIKITLLMYFIKVVKVAQKATLMNSRIIINGDFNFVLPCEFI